MEPENNIEIHDSVNRKAAVAVLLFLMMLALLFSFVEPVKNLILDVLARIFVFLASMAFPRM